MFKVSRAEGPDFRSIWVVRLDTEIGRQLVPEDKSINGFRKSDTCGPSATCLCKTYVCFRACPALEADAGACANGETAHLNVGAPRMCEGANLAQELIPGRSMR